MIFAGGRAFPVARVGTATARCDASIGFCARAGRHEDSQSTPSTSVAYDVSPMGAGGDVLATAHAKGETTGDNNSPRAIY
jgi:hypothetical protein